jgi:hypothetical protein
MSKTNEDFQDVVNAREALAKAKAECDRVGAEHDRVRKEHDAAQALANALAAHVPDGVAVRVATRNDGNWFVAGTPTAA